MLQKFITGILVVVSCVAGYMTYAQACNQPGALVSVRNSYRSHLEYIVFTFVDPYNSKGDLHTATAPFLQLPSGNMIRVKGHHYYKITFSNVFAMCDTKNYYVVPQKNVEDIKPLQHAAGTISYVIGLAAGSKITSHAAYNYHGFHMVKLRVE
jgi:hypothetical protein